MKSKKYKDKIDTATIIVLLICGVYLAAQFLRIPINF